MIIELNYENTERESAEIKILIKLRLAGEELRDFRKSLKVTDWDSNRRINFWLSAITAALLTQIPFSFIHNINVIISTEFYQEQAARNKAKFGAGACPFSQKL